jgi:hypothetical protein
MKAIKLFYHWFNYKTAWFFSPQKPEVEKDCWIEYNNFKTQSK